MAFGKSTDDKDEKGASVTPLRQISGSGGKVEAFLGRGAKVVGNVTFTGPVEIDGYIEGEINAQSMLTIGESATVKAKISGAEILIKGTVEGDINASKKLSLLKPAKVTGNICCSNLSIEEGVIFEGKCVMNSSVAAASTGSGKVGASA
ncbi:MAG: polymer-forming cytoskeletal protein [Candidatus Dadabacteria bacterium]|nr:MAG: polymer-forming cytoskeletal protein [Candidatus Dadabacteria bacterium]